MGIGYAIVSPNLIPVTFFFIMRQLYLTSSVRWCTRLVWFLYFVSLWWLSRRWYDFSMSLCFVLTVTVLLLSICGDLLKKEGRVDRETIRGLLSQRLDKDNHNLEPGDHIYTWRLCYIYAHHGIYGSNGNVIHLTRGEGQKFGLGIGLFGIGAKILINLTRGNTFPSHLEDNPMNPCPTCGYQPNRGGVRVISTCMECFLSGGDLYLFRYAVSVAFFLAKLRGGTCTCAPSDPPKEVLCRAESLLFKDRKGFDVYDLTKNNCEDFAIYCKTGPRIFSDKTGFRNRRTIRVRSSGQAVSLLAVPIVVGCSILCGMGFPGAVMGFGIYCVERISSDVKGRLDSDKQFRRKRWFVSPSGSEEHEAMAEVANES